MKINQIYNVKSFESSFNNEQTRKVLDSAVGGGGLVHNLTKVDPIIFERKFPEVTFDKLGLRVDNSGDHADTIQSLRIDGAGDFTETQTGIQEGKGIISLAGEFNEIKVRQYAATAKWTTAEIRQASMQNYSLVDKYMSTVQRKYMQIVDSIVMIGHRNIPNSGMLNSSEIDFTPASGTISTLTPQQKYETIADLLSSQQSAVNNTLEYMADTCLLPVNVFNDLRRTPLDTASSPSSILRALEENFPNVDFKSSWLCNENNGIPSVTMVFNRSMETCAIRIPVPLNIGGVAEMSHSYFVDGYARVAGFDLLEPSAFKGLTGL